MANRNIIVEEKPIDSEEFQTTPESALVSWIIDTTRPWKQWREQNYDMKWKEYYRIWRGIFKQEDKTRDSERSRLISPATQQAVEATVAELEEATFGKGAWFDLEDDLTDQDKQDMLMYRSRLLEDLGLAKVPANVGKVFLNGAIYGTGIGKIVVDETKKRTISNDGLSASVGVNSPVTEDTDYIEVGVEPIHPLEYYQDPSARSVDEALGCVHEVVKPKHTIIEKQLQNIYMPGPLGSMPDMDIADSQFESKYFDTAEKCKIIEYYGKVPRALMPENEEDIINSILADVEIIDDEDMVEAVVTIANDSVLLKARPNPYLMEDRPIIAYQHDTVTDSFYGRGAVEKGYNSQKALDAELRARIDAMALASHPMVAMDGSRLMRGQNYSVRPGKVWLTNGDPSQIISPFQLNNANQATFHQAGDLERMVQMATGAMDSAAPISQNARNQTASGMSMMQSMFIKRSKRTMKNISECFLDPLIKKSLWRYMQFAPERYPVKDYKFKVIATMGIMAREYEQGQLTQLLSVTDPQSQAFRVLLQGIFENSSLSNKQQLMEALAADAQPNPMDQMAQQAQIQQLQMQLQAMQEEIKKTQSETFRNVADAHKKMADADIDAGKLQLETAKSLFSLGDNSNAKPSGQ